jgi:hypothetical protein
MTNKWLLSFISCLVLLGGTQLGAGASVITHPVKAPRVIPPGHSVKHTMSTHLTTRASVRPPVPRPVPPHTITIAPRPPA